MRNLFFLILLCPSLLWAQKIDLQIGTGIDIGWWVYNKGSNSPNYFNTQGWDRSHLSAGVPLSFSLHTKIKRFYIGAKIDYLTWFNDKMMASNDSDEQVVRYKITEKKYINFINYGVSVKYQLLKKKNYTLLPCFTYGSFWENSIHPQKSNFGKKWLIEVGVENQIYRKNHYFWIRLKYVEKRILPKTPLFFHEKHHIYNLAIDIGIGFIIK